MGSECSSESETWRTIKESGVIDHGRRCTAIVLAAGQGKSMHSKIQKQFMELDGISGALLFSDAVFRKVR